MALVSKIMGGGLSSGQAIAIVGDYNAVTALGSVQGDAALVNTGNSIVAGADATKGVRLPAVSSPGESVLIFNNSASTLKVYPPTGTAIAVPATGLGSANASYAHTTFAVVKYVLITTTQWLPVKSA